MKPISNFALCIISFDLPTKFKKFSKNWWKRRKEAHKYTNYLHIKNNIKKNKNLDELVTNIVNSIVKK